MRYMLRDLIEVRVPIGAGAVVGANGENVSVSRVSSMLLPLGLIGPSSSASSSVIVRVSFLFFFFFFFDYFFRQGLSKS